MVSWHKRFTMAGSEPLFQEADPLHLKLNLKYKCWNKIPLIRNSTWSTNVGIRCSTKKVFFHVIAYLLALLQQIISRDVNVSLTKTLDMFCAPKTATTFEIPSITILDAQWAAVSTCLLVIKAPPQNALLVWFHLFVYNFFKSLLIIWLLYGKCL